MPTKLKAIFQKEYGKRKGERIFYSWLNKMKSKKKAQVVIYTFMLALCIIIVAVALLFPITETTNAVRNESYLGENNGLNCSNPAVDMFVNSACLTTDLTSFYFIGGLIFIAGVVITARIVFS